MIENRISADTIDYLSQKSGMPVVMVEEFLDRLNRATQLISEKIDVIEDGSPKTYTVERRGLGVLTTKFGKFWEYSFTIDDKWQEYSVVVKADIDYATLLPVFKSEHPLPVRIDSGCESGRVFGDLTCDCAEQMQLSLRAIASSDEGIIISIPRHDGRGMGFAFKLATLWAQDVLKLNTVESASLVASDSTFDTRTYGGAIAILKFFQISANRSISVATSNPEKIQVFTENGYRIVDQMAVAAESNAYTADHLRAKQHYFGDQGLDKNTPNAN